MRGSAPERGALSITTIWHDVECGAYAADLPLWDELATEAGGHVLDLGCGSGRVALHLARQGHRVLGLDRDPDLLAALAERAGALPVETERGDARDFDLGVRFDLVLAPMQLIQLLEDGEERRRCLRRVSAHLRPGHVAALAIVEELPGGELTRPLPDVREIDGWVYSSLPLETVVDGGAIVVRRLRQIVSPAGELSEEADDARLRILGATTLEEEAATAGLRPVGRRAIAPTADHVGSTAVLLAKEAA